MPAPGRWMPAWKLRQLFQAGLTYDEIREANYRSEGWRPTRSAVSRKFARMGEPPRYTSHHDLLPWRIKPEHNNDRFRHMLQAESRRRRRAGKMSASDKYLVEMLHQLLFGRGIPMVVGYDPHIGFYLSNRLDTDTDIIRFPVNHDYPADEVLPDDINQKSVELPKFLYGTPESEPAGDDKNGKDGRHSDV